MVSKIRLFTRNAVVKATQVVANPDEPTDPEGGGRFGDWAMLVLHALRIELGKSYRITVDLFSEMPGVLEEFGLTRLSHYTLVHEVYETVPFMLPDSLEAMDSERLVTLLEYPTDYTGYLLVALLSEDASALPDKYNRITEI